MSEQLCRLAKPIPPKYVSAPVTGQFGEYVPHYIINQILLEIVGPFSFEIRDAFYGPDGLIEGCTATLTCTVDGREVRITEVGEADNPTVKKTQGERLKHASSDAFKRCAMRLSLGLKLWSKNDYFLHTHLMARAEQASGSGAAPPVTADPTSVVSSSVPDPDDPLTAPFTEANA